MIGKQTEKHSIFTAVDQPDRQAPAGRISRNEKGSTGFQTRRRPKRSEADMWLKPVYKWIPAPPQSTKKFGTNPVVSEFAHSKPLPRLIMVCAWCERTQNAEGSWRHAENAPQTDTESAISHGICPECAENSYNEYRLAILSANLSPGFSTRAA